LQRYSRPGYAQAVGQDDARALELALQAHGWRAVRRGGSVPNYDRMSGPLSAAHVSTSAWEHDAHPGVEVALDHGRNERTGGRWGSVRLAEAAGIS
jgi:hypothetical protein